MSNDFVYYAVSATGSVGSGWAVGMDGRIHVVATSYWLVNYDKDDHDCILLYVHHF